MRLSRRCGLPGVHANRLVELIERCHREQPAEQLLGDHRRARRDLAEHGWLDEVAGARWAFAAEANFRAVLDRSRDHGPPFAR
jgi:hypothetical protein